MVGGQAPQPKADELQLHPVKDQLPKISYCITSPSPWPEAILLGFHHYLVMLGTMSSSQLLLYPRWEEETFSPDLLTKLTTECLVMQNHHLPCFSEEVPTSCLKKWEPHYDEYQAEMCNAMSINDESKN